MDKQRVYNTIEHYKGMTPEWYEVAVFQPCKDLCETLKENITKHLYEMNYPLDTFFIRARAKELSSCIDKLTRRQKEVIESKRNVEPRMLGLHEFIPDLAGLRIVVSSELEDDCYIIQEDVLNYLKSVGYNYLETRSKDYIKNPKPSGYKGLHTYPFMGNVTESSFEIQFMTERMHEFTEAQHQEYKNESQKRI